MEMEKKCPYINRDDVAQMLIEGVLENNSSPQYAEYIRLLVYSVPSADVAPVRHGRWIEDKLPMYRWGGEKIGEKSILECSVCHDVGFWGYNYCPHCGAKMDGANND